MDTFVSQMIQCSEDWLARASEVLKEGDVDNADEYIAISQDYLDLALQAYEDGLVNRKESWRA